MTWGLQKADLEGPRDLLIPAPFATLQQPPQIEALRARVSYGGVTALGRQTALYKFEASILAEPDSLGRTRCRQPAPAQSRIFGPRWASAACDRPSSKRTHRLRARLRESTSQHADVAAAAWGPHRRNRVVDHAQKFDSVTKTPTSTHPAHSACPAGHLRCPSRWGASCATQRRRACDGSKCPAARTAGCTAKRRSSISRP